MKKRTKVLILVGMVLLLGVTAYLNVSLNTNIVETSTNNNSYTSYFSGYREDRQASRDQMLLYYDAIITSQESSTEAIANAESLKLEIIAEMEKELVMEGLIKAKGFEDAIVTFSNEYVNVVVKSNELQSNEVAQIVEIVKEQTGKSIENIVIIPTE